MLTIRDRQFEALQLDRNRQFENRAVERIQQQYPDDYASFGGDGALSIVRHAMRFGPARGIRSENALAGLIQLFVEFGMGFELAPYRHWALRILDHPALPGPLKVNLIRNRLHALTQGRRMVQHKDAG